MSLRKWVNEKLQKQKNRFFRSLGKRIQKANGNLAPVPVGSPILDLSGGKLWTGEAFELLVLHTARSLATGEDHRVILPTHPQPPLGTDTIRVGFFGNIANNHYIAVKCARRLGMQAELVIEDKGYDAFLLNRPFWEDVEADCEDYESGLVHEKEWTQPEYVIRVAYDLQLQAKYANRLSAISEVQQLYLDTFGVNLPADKALLLAQQMQHWPALLAMKRYDVVQFTAAMISLAPFCPKPYVVYPTGGDLHISPFEETLYGLLMRAGYRQARKLLFGAIDYPSYFDRLQLGAGRVYAPMVIDTEIYSPKAEPELRQKWQQQVGGSIFILSVCRQSWEWKGNDIVLRAFARANHPELRLVLMGWGPDIDKTKTLADELGIADKIIWDKLCSKPVLRQRQNAADLIVDQVVMPGYGTSVLESMAAGKPVLMRLDREDTSQYFEELPPFLVAHQEDDIVRHLQNLPDLKALGQKSREWVVRYHGYANTVPAIYGPAYLEAVQSVCRPMVATR